MYSLFSSVLKEEGLNLLIENLGEVEEERFISTVACKSAVKAHMALDNQEVEKLLDELLKLPNPVKICEKIINFFINSVNKSVKFYRNLNINKLKSPL